MNKIGKIVLGVGVITIIGAVVYSSTKKTPAERKYTDINSPEESNIDISLMERIKIGAAKKVLKILAWVALNQKKIESVTVILGLAGAIANIYKSFKEIAMGKEQMKKLNDIYDLISHTDHLISECC